MKIKISFLASSGPDNMIVGEREATTTPAQKNEAIRAALGDAEAQLKSTHGNNVSISRWTVKES